jgi:hypothetical protein
MLRYARLAHAGLAWLVPVVVLVQAFLAGMFVFGQSQFRATHIEVGYSIAGLIVFAFLVSLVFTRPDRLQVGLVVLVVVVYFVQTLLPVAARSGLPVVAALHPVNAFVLFGLGLVTARRATERARATELPG